MATTKIWSVKGRIDRVISYASNLDKTLYTEEDLQVLRDVMDYAMQDYKTEKQYYVTALNCNEEKARLHMSETKKRYGKTDGIVAFHGYQSFVPGEVTPTIAHKIGVELAQKMWGEKYEIIVATHIDKKHIHNHFVINSVSFRDGKKYNACRESYRLLREKSDELCREYGLSVIEESKNRSHKSYDLYMAEKKGEWTKDSIIKRDIDECILNTTSTKAFYFEMKKLGYGFNFNRKYPTISHPNFERPRRLKTLGQDYTVDGIEERIMSKWKKYSIDIPQQDNLVEDFFMPLVEPTYQEIYVSFVTVVQYVRTNPKTNREIDKYLIDEMRKLDKLIEQQNLLCCNDIETSEQLTEYKSVCESELKECDDGRKALRNKLKVAIRNNDKKEIAEIKNAISTLSERMKILRKDIRISDRIQATEPKIEEKINKIMNDKERREMSVDERFRRCSRTNSENDITRR